MRRPRAEHAERLNATSLRALVAPGAERHTLADGTTLQLRWRTLSGCFGGAGGVALLVGCPGCDATARVLYRPAGRTWGCWRCHPISHRSHRRSGARRGRPKPTSWRLDQITAEQRRTAEHLGLQQWPPERLIWGVADLFSAPLVPGAPRLSRDRQLALVLRLDALETLRLVVLLPEIDAELKRLDPESEGLPQWPGMESKAARARRVVGQTAWAMRRPAGDPRTPRRDARCAVTGTTAGIASDGVCDCNGRESGESEGSGLAHCATTDRVEASKRWQSWQP